MQNQKIKIAYKEEYFICDICLKNYSNKSNLTSHINTIHRKILPYSCPFSNCEKSYPNKSRLKVHLRTHTGEKPFKCPICNKTFNEKGNLKIHVIKHNPNQRFQCPQCSKNYKSKGHLGEHVNIVHLNIKKHICNYCNKKFGKKSILNEHIRTHTREKPFKCLLDGCNKYFAEKGNMRSHYKRHFKNKNDVIIERKNENNNIDCLHDSKDSNGTYCNSEHFTFGNVIINDNDSFFNDDDMF